MASRRTPRRAAAIATAALLALPAAAAADLTEEAGSPHAVGANPYWVATADFDDDGRQDLATANDSAGTVTVLLRQPGGGYAEEAGSPINVGERPDAVAVADFNQDARQDLAVTNFSSDTVTILLRRPDGGFAEEDGSPLPTGPRPHSVHAADIDGDDLPDLAIPNYAAGTVTILLRQPGGGFAEAPGSPLAVGIAPTQIAAADFDGDGRQELAVADRGSDELTILEPQPNGDYSVSSLPAGRRPVSPATGDFDHDGDPDLAVTNEDSDDITVYLHDGDGFAPAATYNAGDGPYGLAAGDFDHDGRTDLAASNHGANDVTVLLQRDAGGFAPAPFSPVATGHTPLQLTATDVDDDGELDLAVPNNADSTVSVLVHQSDTNAPETTITAGPHNGDDVKASPTFEFESSEPGSTFACTRTFAPGTLLQKRTPFDCDSPATLDLTTPGEYRFSVSAIDRAGNTDPTPAERTFTLLGPPPRNLALPEIVPDAGNPHVYRCDPGKWEGRDAERPYHFAWQRLTPDRSYLSGYRTETVATTQTYRAAASSTLQLATLSWRFQCVAEAANSSGSTAATSAATQLDPVVDELLSGRPYGNFRIRGIDVFQVVQPNSGAKMYAFPKGAGFPAFPGGGTPTDWRLVPAPGGLGLSTPKPADTDPQTVAYQGLTLDRHMPTTAIVYVDMQNAKAAAADQRLKVTIKVSEGNAVYRQYAHIITDPPASGTPWVTAGERGNKRFGVAFDISVLHGVTAGGTFKVQANVEFDPDNTAWNARECDTGNCNSDNHFALTGVKVDDGYANGELMIRAVDLFRDGQPAPPGAYDVLRRRTLFPNPLGLSLTDYGGARINITAAVNKTGNEKECQAITVRQCRQNAVSLLLDQYSANNPARTFADGLVTRNYDVLMGVENYDNEPGWASGPNAPGIGDQGPSRDVTQITTQGPVGPAPRLVVNCCTRPITAAAHELGHILSAPHSDTTCGGPAGGGAEPWPDDMTGRLQGTRFTGPGSAPEVDAATPLYDLMSYCADLSDTAAALGNAWISPFNWNRFAYQFTKLGERGLTRGARVFAQQQATPARMAYASGSVSAHGGQITNVTGPDEDSVAPLPVPRSPLRLRALDANGHVIAEAGAQITPSELPGAATFGGPVPAEAARVELIRGGRLLDRLSRSRAPHVTLLTAGRTVRWRATDTDGDPLTATIDASSDRGRHWHTVYIGPNNGHARIPPRSWPRSHHPRLRVSVTDGFNTTRTR